LSTDSSFHKTCKQIKNYSITSDRWPDIGSLLEVYGSSFLVAPILVWQMLPAESAGQGGDVEDLRREECDLK
jgi:hypothetical protein